MKELLEKNEKVADSDNKVKDLEKKLHQLLPDLPVDDWLAHVSQLPLRARGRRVPPTAQFARVCFLVNLVSTDRHRTAGLRSAIDIRLGRYYKAQLRAAAKGAPRTRMHAKLPPWRSVRAGVTVDPVPRAEASGGAGSGITAARFIAGGPPTKIFTFSGTPASIADEWCTPIPRCS